jgi:hypothetical protein
MLTKRGMIVQETPGPRPKAVTLFSSQGLAVEEPRPQDPLRASVPG